MNPNLDYSEPIDTNKNEKLDEIDLQQLHSSVNIDEISLNNNKNLELNNYSYRYN